MSRNTRALFHCDRIGWDSQESFVVIQASGWEEARMNDEALFGRSSDARGGGCCGGRQLPGCGQAVQHRREQGCAVGAAVPADRGASGPSRWAGSAIRVSKTSE